MRLARQQAIRLDCSAERFHTPSRLTPFAFPESRSSFRQTLLKSSVLAAAADSEVIDSQQQSGAEGSHQQSADLEPTKRLLLRFSTANIPHPEKSDYGGEDAFFTSTVGGGAFGVADGVGGWQDSGINPAEYSRTFMCIACAYLEGKRVETITPHELQQGLFGGTSNRNGLPADASLKDAPPEESAGKAVSMKTLTPKGALTAAHTGTRLPGSTTACVLRLDRTSNKLSAANLGDSGFLLIRNGAVSFRSPALQHFFDCPLQFAAYPDFTNATDTSDDAGLYEIPVQAGDLIVAGTDGLWDNVPQEEILSSMPPSPTQLSQAAPNLAQLASKHAHDKKFPSPYSQEAVKQGIDLPWFLKLANSSFSDGKFRLGHMKGGKVDDITIIVAYVDEETFTPDQATQVAASGIV